MVEKLLSAQAEFFCIEYIKDLNATQACARAGYARGSAYAQAAKLMADERVKKRIAELIAERAKVVKLDANVLLKQMADVAACDVNEIIKHVVINCRRCWGVEHQYQRVPHEHREALRAYNKSCVALNKAGMGDEIEAFDDGGKDYDQTRAPNPACPACKGVGVTVTRIADTRTLSPGARALYAGVKHTKDGIEVKFFNKEKYIEMLARHLSLFNDKLIVTDSLSERINASRKRAGKR